MSFFTIMGIAFGLAMDAFAVSVASGIAMTHSRMRHAFRIALSFGLFQALMPVVGWLCGRSAREFIVGVDHWVAFVLLSGVGIKMIYEAWRMGASEGRSKVPGFYLLLLLSVATSLDALVVGFSFAFLGVPILTPVIVIGFVTFLLSFIGASIGGRLGHFFEKKIEALGGLVLIGIGLKILIEHLVAKP